MVLIFYASQHIILKGMATTPTNIFFSEDLSSYALYLKNNSPGDIINEFFNDSLENVVVSNSDTPDDDASSKKYYISWKNMHFIWKLFISKNSLPNMFYSNSLKKLLKERCAYDEPTDSFYNVTSKYLPFVSHFIQFWKILLLHAVARILIMKLK